ncbi:MAG TPA: LysM peptidoglycan-binding domain-containing protein [Pirellulales bacterium]|nr:LysM peptidoglycan-binding domain-containing protein [Pirellulales bacterium]
MNTLKPLLIFAVLIGVCYGVYSRINNKPAAPPPEAMVNWDTAEPNVQMTDRAAGTGDNRTSGPLGNSFMGGASPNAAPPSGAPPAGGGNFPPSATFTLGPGGAAPRADGAPAGDPQAGGWAPPVENVAGNGQYDAMPGAGGAGGQPLPNQYDNNAYGPPAGYGQDPGNGQAVPPGQPPGGYGQMPAGGSDQGGIDPSRPAADSYGADGGRGGAPMTAFTAALEQVQHELDAGRLSEAHCLLSRWYDEPTLNPQEQQHLNELLDQLAGTVIYSTQNLMEPACEVQQGETLERIAQRYNVPWQLLAKINGISDPHALRPGERLKVVRGPFSAVISLEKHTLTLMLANAYAGRFTIGVGQDSPPPEGQYFVKEKVVDPIYYGPGRTIERGDPANPLGRRWLGLGGQVGIHGTNDPRNIGQTGVPGSISMADRDVDDVFDILSEDSKVVIRR